MSHSCWFTPEHLCAEVARLAQHFAPAGARLVEPCAGDGRIAALLPGCEAFDLEPRSPAVRRQDALAWRGDSPFFVATNVPFSLAKKLLRHWAADPMWRGAVVIMPAIAWRWTWDVPGAELVLDGNRDERYECAFSGKHRLIKSQLQVWTPGDSGEPILPRRWLRYETIGHVPSPGVIGWQAIGCDPRNPPREWVRPPLQPTGRPYHARRNLSEVVPGALTALLSCDKPIVEARSTAQPYLTEQLLNEFFERHNLHESL